MSKLMIKHAVRWKYMEFKVFRFRTLSVLSPPVRHPGEVKGRRERDRSHRLTVLVSTSSSLSSSWVGILTGHGQSGILLPFGLNEAYRSILASSLWGKRSILSYVMMSMPRDFGYEGELKIVLKLRTQTKCFEPLGIVTKLFVVAFGMMVWELTTILKNRLSAQQAKQIHAYIIVNNLHNLESLLVGQILFCGCNYSRQNVQYAQNILYHLQKPDAFSWGSTIRYFSQHGQFKEALSHYVQMQRKGICPSTFALSSVLRACGRIVDKMSGASVHAQSHKYGFCSSVYVQTALVDLYSKLKDMNAAQKVFDEMVEKNVVSWNSILSGYLKSGNLLEAQRVFNQIPTKDVVSWNSLISGYAKEGAMDQACSLFEQMPERNYASWNSMISGYVDCGNIKSARSMFNAMPQRNNISWMTMIAGYSKCGDVVAARELFDQMSKKDLLSFNAMISCYAQNSHPKLALQLFDEMLKAHVEIQPDERTLASILSAASQLGDLRLGSWIESYIKDRGMEIGNHVVTAFIDWYAKCGDMSKAYELFHGLKKKDVVAYSAMIFGCGINGKVAEAMKLFEEMGRAQICPNLVTFTGLLTAYNHCGLVDEGYRCFNSMKDHALVPLADHYAIMVDLLGRAGSLQEAYGLIKSMPMKPHAGVWGALLLASGVHNNLEFGRIAAAHCLELEPNATGYYSLLANIYASVGKWDDARRLRKEIKKKKLTKLQGYSWMEST